MSDRFTITKIAGREILDSRGNPTVEAVAYSDDIHESAAVPSGASTGRHEALELRDGDAKRYKGLGVLKAVRNIEEIIGPKLKDLDPRQQANIDRVMIELDGTPNKSRLGANAILAVSLAVAKLASRVEDKPLYEYLSDGQGRLLPVPVMNVINGGKHAGSDLKIQEFMIIPSAAKSFTEALRVGTEIYHTLKFVIQTKYRKQGINVGDEGGFAPPLKKTNEALDLLVRAVSESGYEAGKDVFLGFDAASSEFFHDNAYMIDGKKMSADKLSEFYLHLIEDFPIRYIEDPFEQEDFENTALFTRKVGNRVQIVGDDIFVTNLTRLRKGIDVCAANALLLKINQIGTLTEAMEAAKLATDNRYSVVTSHRSGETDDSTISDLAVALNCGQIKAGAPCRGERTAKYNRLIRIEEELGNKAQFAGLNAFQYS